jgi:hypothetical protein
LLLFGISGEANMRILKDCSFLSLEGIKSIEEKYNAKYVFESPLKDKNGNWTDQSFAIFYTEIAHPEGSNYFGIYYSNDGWMITNGITAVQDPFQAVCIDEDIVYSRYRHDYRSHNGIFVDGGRDYLRWGGGRLSEGKVVSLKVNEGRLELID